MQFKNARTTLILTILFILITSFSSVYAAEKDEKKSITSSESVKAKVIEAGKKTERKNGNTVDYIQNVKVKILEGDRKGEKYEGIYVLSYDLNNKIISYELNKGNTVYIQLSEYSDGEIVIEVEDVVRQNYLILLVAFFFGSILLIGRKKGIKAIIGLVITVVSIYVILLLSIYKGYNAILMSIITSFIIIILTFIVISGINKKTISASLGTLGGIVFAGIIAFIFGYIAKLAGGRTRRCCNTKCSSNSYR